MKKLLSIVLAVALLASFTCISVSAEPTVVDKNSDFSLLPGAASDFTCIEAGEGKVTVTKDGDSFVFKSDKGWPYAFTNASTATDNPATWASASFLGSDEIYLNFDFEVKSGASKVLVYFCGQNPQDMAAAGNFVDLNCFVLNEFDPATGQTDKDLGVGKYNGSIKLGDLYENVDYLKQPYVNPDLVVDDVTFISGVKVFAVAGEVVVNDISVGKKKYDAPKMVTNELNLLTNGATNGANGESEVTFKDGAYEVKVTKGWNKDDNTAYGMQVAAGLKDFDLGATTMLHVGIDSDTPWRLTTFDSEINKWLGLGANFGECNGQASAPDGDGFYPAGKYEICVDYGSIYTWNANNGDSTFDVTSACLDGLYFEAKDAGTMKVTTLKLSSKNTFEATPGTNTGEGASNDDVQGDEGDNNTTKPADDSNDATTKKTTTTAKKTGTDDKTDNVETGDVSSAVLFAVIAVIALAVVALSAKVKAR